MSAAKQYSYGVRWTKHGLRSFWMRGHYDAMKNGAAVAVRLLKTEDKTEPGDRAEKLLREFQLGQLSAYDEPVVINQLGPGQFCTHADGERHHKCLIIGDHSDVFHALMLTTNPKWNKHCRRATDVEVAQLMPSQYRSSREQFLAPVTRPRSQFFTPTHALDEAKLAEYRAEFGDVFGPRRSQTQE